MSDKKNNISSMDKIKLIFDNANTIFPLSEYEIVLNKLAGSTTDDDLESIYESQYSSYLNKTGDFTATYIPLALLFYLDNKCKFSSKEPIEIACDEFACNDDLYEALMSPNLFDILESRGISFSEVSLSDYISKRLFLKDLDLLYDLVKPKEDESTNEDNDIIEETKKFYAGYIRSTVDYIIEIYEDIFASGYEVVQPYGVLSAHGCEVLNSSDERTINSSLEILGICKSILPKLDLRAESGRGFNVNEILKIQLSEDKSCAVGSTPYYPHKMLEYALGRSSIDYSKSDRHYPVDESAISWDSYSAKCIRKGLTDALMQMIIDALKSRDWLKSFSEDTNKNIQSAESVMLVQDICDKSKIALTACVLVSEWKVADNIVIGLKIRAVDTSNKLPTDGSIINEIIKESFSNFAPKGTVIMPVARRGKFVKEYAVQFNSQLCEAEPLFAFKALDSMKRRGIEPSWNNLLLGKYEDDSVLSANDKKLRLKDNLCHFIIAGSRSGKGVMTLNTLASAIASKKPIFYLDRKPDMASLLKKMANGKMFIINGSDYQSKYDPDGLFTEDALRGWDKHIPDSIMTMLGGNRNAYTSLADLFYLRALIFVLGILDIRVSASGNKALLDKLGGKDGIVLVVDEISNTMGGLDNFMSEVGLFFSNATKTSELRKRLDKVNKAKEKDPMSSESLPDIEVYATAFVDSFCETLKNIRGRMKAGWKGNVEKNDIFILGQDIKRYNHEEGVLKPTKTAGIATGQDSFIIQNMFIKMSADGFFGYNLDFPNYLNASDPSSKASVKLTNTARNFAYVPSLTFDTLGKVINSDKNTSDNAVYFKPFLILNDNAEDSPSVQDFKTFCSGNKVSYESVKSLNSDGNGNFDPRIGFAKYIESQSPNVNIAEILGQSYEIGNYVVQKMGYTEGDCLDFVFDLRPEWMLTVEEIRDKFFGKNVETVACKIIKEYAPHLMSSSDDMDSLSDEEKEAVIQQRQSTSDLFNKRDDSDNNYQYNSSSDDSIGGLGSGNQQGASSNQFTESPIVTDDPLPDYFTKNRYKDDVVDEVIADKSKDNSNILSDEELDNLANSGKGTLNYNDLVNTHEILFPEGIGDQSDVDDEDEFFNNSQISSKEVAPDLNTPVDANAETVNPEILDANKEPLNKDEYTLELERQLAEQQRIISEQNAKIDKILSYMQGSEMDKRIKEEQEKLKNKQIEQERIVSEPYTMSFFGRPVKMQNYQGKLNIEDEIAITEDTASTSQALVIVTDYILRDIANMFSGLDRITDFAIISDALIFNSVVYAPEIPLNVIKKLPLDVQNDVRNGRLAWIFLFHKLRDMPNLTNLAFNSVDFVFKKVRIDLGKDKDFEPKDLFGVCPKLMNLQIENYGITRKNMNEFDDVFHAPRRSTVIMDNMDSWGINTTKNNWQSVKNIYSDPSKRGFWKATQLTFMTGATATTGLATLGLRAGRHLGKFGKKFLGGVKEVTQAMKENRH